MEQELQICSCLHRVRFDMSVQIATPVAIPHRRARIAAQHRPLMTVPDPLAIIVVKVQVILPVSFRNPLDVLCTSQWSLHQVYRMPIAALTPQLIGTVSLPLGPDGHIPAHIPAVMTTTQRLTRDLLRDYRPRLVLCLC